MRSNARARRHLGAMGRGGTGVRLEGQGRDPLLIFYRMTNWLRESRRAKGKVKEGVGRGSDPPGGCRTKVVLVFVVHWVQVRRGDMLSLGSCVEDIPVRIMLASFSDGCSIRCSRPCLKGTHS